MKLEINSQSPEPLRLAYRFWIELGRPSRFHKCKTLEAWANSIELLCNKSGVDFEEFKWFLIWALRPDEPDGARLGNDFTARNLRMAQDPMASLVKQFDVTFEIWSEKLEKIAPLLVAKRREEDAAAAMAAEALQEAQSFRAPDDTEEPPMRWRDLLPPDPTPFEIEWVRHMEALDTRFPFRGPRAGETVDQWIEREFTSLRDPDWRCPKCGYGSDDPGAERTAWCSDCAEEAWMYAIEDLEMLYEVETVSCLTGEWE